MNKNCTDKWLKDKDHLKNCDCLEQEVREICSLFANSLKKSKEKLKKYKCELSNKPRTPYYDSASYGYTYCQKCEVEVRGKWKLLKIGMIQNFED